MHRIRLCLIGCLCLITLASCKQKRDVSEMSDEEKVALEVADESSLSDSEKERQREVRQAILDQTHKTQEGEAGMKDALDNARDLLDPAVFEALEQAQDKWLKTGRGKDINALVAQGTAAADAFAKSAAMRADWIRTRTSWAMLIDMPGKYGGFYRADQGRTLEIYEMNEGILNLVIRMDGQDFVFTASGVIDEGTLASELDPTARITLKPSQDAMVVDLADGFAQSKAASMGTLIAGRYARVKPGEFDVFAP